MNKYNPDIHHRRSIRLKGFDYSKEGLYFITICCQKRECLFGKVSEQEGLVELNSAGTMIQSEWLKLPSRFPNIRLHEYIVMPNHFHGIVEIVGATLVVAQNKAVIIADNDIRDKEQGTDLMNDKGQEINPTIIKGQPQVIAPTVSQIVSSRVGDMIGAFKSITAGSYIRGVKQASWKPFNGKLWQRDYYEHVIRNEPAYENISNYIINNPRKWAEDRFYT